MTVTLGVRRDMESLVNDNIALAYSIAYQVWRRAQFALELDEMRAIAGLGLVDAANRWEPYCEQNGYSPERLEFFKPYLMRRVRGQLMDAIRSSDWASRSLRTRAKALQAAGQGTKGMTHEMLAARTGLTLVEVRSTIRGMAQRPVSLEGEELDPSSSQDVESSTFCRSVLADVNTCIRSLPAEQQVVLALYYYYGYQFQQIAYALDIPESQVSALHAEAVLAVHVQMLQSAKNHPEEEQ